MKNGNGEMTAWDPLRRHEIAEPGEETKPKRRRSGAQEEAREQKRFVRWARDRGLEIQHQNNGSGSKKRRIHLHQMGCTAGAADLLVFNRLPNYPEARGLALEFKSSSGAQSKEQKKWAWRMEELGWVYRVVRSAEEAKEIVKGCGL